MSFIKNLIGLSAWTVSSDTYSHYAKHSHWKGYCKHWYENAEYITKNDWDGDCKNEIKRQLWERIKEVRECFEKEQSLNKKEAYLDEPPFEAHWIKGENRFKDKCRIYLNKVD